MTTLPLAGGGRVSFGWAKNCLQNFSQKTHIRKVA
jgi:hypothetical protein